MKRRAFLQKSSLLIAGAAYAGLQGLTPRRALAAAAQPADFSIDVVTAEPDRAIRLIEQVIASSALGGRTVTFTEYRLTGSHVGDIALVRGQQLVDYRRGADGLSRRLARVAEALDLPRRYDHPALLRFYAGEPGAAPQHANVFCGDVLVEQLPLGENRAGHRVEGARGHVELAVQDRAVRITGASCKHKTCMELGAISRPGQTLVCIPAQISVALDGSGRSDVDGMTF